VNDPAGVLVEWPTPEPTTAPTPAPSPTAGSETAETADVPVKKPAAAPAGYWVRRRPQGGEAKNLTTRPVPAPPYVDDSAEPGRTYCYTVRHVVSLSPLVASPDSPEACLEVKDVRPPDAPRGVTLLPRVDHLEVSWSPSSETDLATYRVYRSRAGETDAARVADLPPTARSYHDKDVTRGVSYQYVVTGVDRHGNESARSSPVSGALP
jgi:hypothetical protein